MYDSFDRRVDMIADGIGILVWCRHELFDARNELPRDRIVRIVAVDQRSHRRRHRHGIALRDAFEFRRHFGHKPGFRELSRRAQGRGVHAADAINGTIRHASSGGVHTT